MALGHYVEVHRRGSIMMGIQHLRMSIGVIILQAFTNSRGLTVVLPLFG